MKRIPIAIVGCGAVSELYHLPVFRAMPEFEIKYLVDVNEERMRYLKEKYRLSCEISTDFSHVLQDESLEAVSILTPPKLHYSMVKDAAQANLNVFCEKPFAMSSNEAKEMIDVCRKNNVTLLPGFNFRYISQFRKLKSLMQGGFFGTLVGASSTMFTNAFSWPSVTKFQYDKKIGGGALFEMGVHHVDLMNWLFGVPQTVSANINIYKNSVIDDTAYVNIRYKNGSNCNIFTGWNGLSINTITVIGTDGYASATSNKNEVIYYRADLVGQPPLKIKTERTLNPYHEEMKHFYNIIRKGDKSVFTDEELINSINVVEMAYESSNNSGKVIDNES